MMRAIAMSRNFKNLIVIFLISSVLCLLIIEQNSQREHQLNIGQQFLRQLNQLRTNNLGDENNFKNETGDSSDDSEKTIQRDKELSLFKSEKEIEVGIWIDIPNAFPWR